MTTNHCVHGVELSAYCPTCELDIQDFERWLRMPTPMIWEIWSIPNLLHDCTAE